MTKCLVYIENDLRSRLFLSCQKRGTLSVKVSCVNENCDLMHVFSKEKGTRRCP